MINAQGTNPGKYALSIFEILDKAKMLQIHQQAMLILRVMWEIMMAMHGEAKM